jgi:hypothetical protein
MVVERAEADPVRMRTAGSTPTGPCPSCGQGDLITISMALGGRDVTFSTCHLCEAKWWFSDGRLVPLSSVLDLVVGG